MNLIQKFLDNPNLKKENSERLAKRFGVTVDQVKEARKSLNSFSIKLNELIIVKNIIKVKK